MRGHVTTRWLPAVAFLFLAVLGVAAPAAAHATLVDTDPDQGAVLDRLPDVVTLTFNEHVRGVPDGVRVYDAQGTELASSAKTHDKELLVTIEDEVSEGTVVVAWRVVSADGHPIAGNLTFSVGAPSAETATPSAKSAPRAVASALSLSRWPAYAGLLLAVGLVWFLELLVPVGADIGEGVKGRLRRTARIAAVISAVVWLVGLPLDALYLRGTGLSTALDAATWESLPVRELLLTLLLVAALIGAVLWDGEIAVVLALCALAPVALVGHSVAMNHTQLNVLVDGLHLAAAAAWLGGLVGLLVLLGSPPTSDATMSRVVGRFSTLAAALLATLVVTGSVLAWQLVGSWRGLVDSGYGQVLLGKIALVAVAVAIATYNRFRLVPHGPSAHRTLARTISLEATVLVAVVLVTSFLVQKSPPAGVDNEVPLASRPAVGHTDLGGLRATVTLDPAAVGTNIVTVEIDSSDGTPAEVLIPPELRVLGEDADVGDVTIKPVRLGVYQGSVVLPVKGTWRFQVSLRVEEFTNPVATVQLEVH